MEERKSFEERITPLAVTNWRDIRKRFGIKQKNRRGHIYVIGKTGTGKSSLLGNMMISDLEQGSGFALIDPHGDLVEAMLDYVPEGRQAEVIYFNPGDIDYPIAFNPLESVHPDQHHLVVSGLISVFKKIWSEFWGPRLEHILRHSLFTLLELPGSTLLDIPRLLTEPQFRKAVVSTLNRQDVKSFWLTEFEHYSAWLKAEATAPILNKVGQFLTSLPLRNVVGQSRSSFNFREVMDQGKILLVNLAKGSIGEDNCSLLGAMLVTEIQLAALSRVDKPEADRKPFYLYVDEVHNFLTASFVDVLSESRKYGLNLTLANQFTEQLDESIRAAIFGNVGTLISFRVGTEDAELLAKEFYPVFTPSDLVGLPNYNMYLKLMIDGVSSNPFSAATLPLPSFSQSFAEQIVHLSRNRYSRPRKEVEARNTLRLAQNRLQDDKQPTLFS
ncbi:MAG: type IV secretion system DNA-binding domain-containing protein [Ignavibacteria bacterium]|nr:type IV secretion system DNA-binding domain-containing protein [Ignavibacteria bacterium]